MIERYIKNMKWWFEIKRNLKYYLKSPYYRLDKYKIYVTSYWRKNKIKKYCENHKEFTCKIYRNKVFITQKELAISRG